MASIVSKVEPWAKTLVGMSSILRRFEVLAAAGADSAKPFYVADASLALRHLGLLIAVHGVLGRSVPQALPKTLAEAMKPFETECGNFTAAVKACSNEGAQVPRRQSCRYHH